MKSKAILDLDVSSRSYQPPLNPHDQELPFYLQSLGIYTAQKHYQTKRQGMKSHLLLYTLAGCGRIEYAGHVKTLPVNHIALLDCRQSHRYHTHADDPKTSHWDFLYAHFDGDGVPAYVNRINGAGLQAIALPDGIKNPIAEHLISLFEQVQDESDAASLATALILHQLLSEWTGLKPHQSPSLPILHRQAIENLLTILKKQHAQNWSLAAMAQKVHLSPYHFSRLFKEFTHETPHAWLLDYRIRESKKSLRHSDLSIQEIAAVHGFSDASSFIRAFRHQVGVTPLQYRHQQRLF